MIYFFAFMMSGNWTSGTGFSSKWSGRKNLFAMIVNMSADKNQKAATK